MENHEENNAFGVINKPPSFTGRKCDLEGFLTRAELAMESRPNQFNNDAARVRFLMSYMLGKPLEWVSCLRRNNSPLLNSYDDFVKELKSNFGDYTSESIVANSKLCSIYQKKNGHVFEYISEFQRIAQYSDFNESAKIYMFIRGLKQPLREKLALIDPNPRSLDRLTTTVLNIESLIRRNEKVEFFSNTAAHNDPMDIDLYRIKRGPNERKYTYRPIKYKEEKRDYSEERKKGVCFLCKQPGHLKFNCPNKIKPKNLRLIMKGKDTDDSVMGNFSNMRRIRRLTEQEELVMMREVTCEDKNQQKTNILDFFIKTNEIEESKVKVLIDSGSIKFW